MKKKTRRKKSNGVEEIFNIIMEVAKSGLSIYKKAKPLIDEITKKPKK